MPRKKLSLLLAGLDTRIQGEGDPEITSLAYDSRDVESGTLFFALGGVHVDGHDYIDAALDAGAAAVVHSRPPALYQPGVVYVSVDDPRRAMSPVSAEFFDHPSKELTVIGVTGTDGKSTTVSFIRQLLEFTEAPTGCISTVEFAVGGGGGANPLRQSTPEAPQIHGLLRAMLDAGKTHAVVEATSHGLALRNSRLADVAFDAAVFTNVTSEHLEFHGTLEAYRADKARLFQMVGASPGDDAFGVVNMDDPHAHIFIEAAGEKPVFTYSLKNEEADILAVDLEPGPASTDFVLKTPWDEVSTRIALPGIYNVENALAAVCAAAEIRGEDVMELAEQLPLLEGVKGRMEPVPGGMDFHVMVDYAHSPGSFSKILPFLQTLVQGRLILVFGSAGERDLEKRPKQGALASEFADVVVLTDEDPRGEDSMHILEDIALGMKEMKRDEELFLISDRRQALKKAFSLAEKGDLVAVLGKGHENSIIYADGPRKWDEAGVCREVLQELGYTTE